MTRAQKQTADIIRQQAETISKLKDLVEDAYFYGRSDGQNDEDGCWGEIKSDLENL